MDLPGQRGQSVGPSCLDPRDPLRGACCLDRLAESHLPDRLDRPKVDWKQPVVLEFRVRLPAVPEQVLHWRLLERG